MVKINTSKLQDRLEWVVKGKKRQCIRGSKFRARFQTGKPSEGKEDDERA